MPYQLSQEVSSEKQDNYSSAPSPPAAPLRPDPVNPEVCLHLLHTQLHQSKLPTCKNFPTKVGDNMIFSWYLTELLVLVA